MQDHGWIKVRRDIFQSIMFDDQPLSKREAWLWLVATAAHTNMQYSVNKRFVKIARGFVETSLLNLQIAWGWQQIADVMNFLNLLEINKMIIHDRGAEAISILIVNYDQYQDDDELAAVKGVEA